jgi:hypothetical protein
MWKFVFRKRVPPNPAASHVSGVSIIFLQKRLERFTTEQLSLAMKRGWRREHDPVEFFATTLGDGEGAVIKFNGMFITMQHFDHRLDTSALGDQELPKWALYGAHSSLTYACPGVFPSERLEISFIAFLGCSVQNCSVKMFSDSSSRKSVR